MSGERLQDHWSSGCKLRTLTVGLILEMISSTAECCVITAELIDKLKLTRKTCNTYCRLENVCENLIIANIHEFVTWQIQSSR